MAEKTLEYLDPESLSKLKGLDLIAKLVVEGFLTGLHKSPYHGFSVEFAEHRPYMPGDPLKHVDWKLYGKSDRFYTKRYEQETNLRSHILLDVSASMGYASEGRVTKFQYASYLGASLAYLMLMQQDAVGLLTFKNSIEKMIPARANSAHLKLLLAELEKAKPSSTTEMSTALNQMAERIQRRGLVILISDLMDEPERVMEALKHFRYRDHEVVVFHVLDPFEIDFPFKEESSFVDLETGDELMTHPWEIATEYKRRFEEWQAKYKRMCLESRIEYEPLSTKTPYDRALLRYLEKRKKLN